MGVMGIAPNCCPNYSSETSIDHSLVLLDCVGVEKGNSLFRFGNCS